MPIDSRLVIAEGDITAEAVDAIVNAANESLLGGGGVDGAIHRAAGPELLEACREIGGCPTGAARLTPGFRLAARWVIHTVGPVWRGGEAGEDDLLASCNRESMVLARGHDVATISFPAISTGVYGFPADRAAAIALTTLSKALRGDGRMEAVRLVFFDGRARRTAEAARDRLAG